MIPEYYLFDTFCGKRLHLGVTGSIAAYKALDLARIFLGLQIQVGITLTEAAQRFVTPMSFEALGASPLHHGLFRAGADYDHLEPSCADAFLVAPATANTLAKMAHGLADNLLSCQLLAFPGPILAAPAMNPRMWQAPATQTNWSTLLSRGVCGIDPEHGTVACGDTGQGRLASIQEIFLATLRTLSPQDMRGKKVLLTLGPTQEHFDQTRFWSNPSTGTMGTALAVSAALRGAEVIAVHGPLSFSLPSCLRAIAVTTAREMYDATHAYAAEQDILCCTAAVADFRPPSCPQQKFKKTGQSLQLVFASNPDILLNLGRKKQPGQFLIGFAAEAENLLQNAAAKLQRKNLDLIVANPVGEKGAGFGSATNRVEILDAQGRRESWPQLPKTEVAWRIWDWTLQNLA